MIRIDSWYNNSGHCASRSLHVLFVSSAGSRGEVSPIVRNQGQSLLEEGLNIEYFLISGKGLIGYLKHIPKIRKHVQTGNYDLIHAHYALSAMAAGLGFLKVPMIASLMGSEARMSWLWRLAIRWFSLRIWAATIVKSDDMKSILKIDRAAVIPNGVDLIQFAPRDKWEAQARLDLRRDKKHVIFVADPSRYEKNFPLAEQAVGLLRDPNVELHAVHDLPYQEVMDWFYAADALILASRWEGSPNVIKEALASNLPLVSTDVGDVARLIKGVRGCSLASTEPFDIAAKLKDALEFSANSGKTQGRDRIMELELDSRAVARKIIEVYESALNMSVACDTV